MEGQASLLFSTLKSQGWVELLDVHFVRFSTIGLSIASSDREVWHQAQSAGMLLLTANRSMIGPGSLEQTIREESTLVSLPVLTVGHVERMDERIYREECADRIAEIIMDLDQYRGAGRLYIP